MFDNASGFVIHNSQIIDNSLNVNHHSNASGLEMLLRASIPEAAHDSSARWPPPSCFPGTREQHIRDIKQWASSARVGQEHHLRMTWMSGPAGVGKSALAQTCAEEIGKDGFGAAFFFSRLNQRDDPDRFFPSIAYQISTKVKPFASILDEKIREDPSLLSKAIEVQFQELILTPFLELKARDEKIQERLVVVDGLDECSDDDAQCVFVELIAAAIREHGENLPLLWAFFGRPEPHLVRIFSSDTVSPLCRATMLHVSRDIDQEIELYLRGGFENIKKRFNHIISFADTCWPTDMDIKTLVDMSAGLFVYSATALKFIGDPDAMDPKERLKAVLSLRSGDPLLTDNRQSPTRELDNLYTLVMQRIPTSVLPFTQQILLLYHQAPMIRVTYGGRDEGNWAQVIPVLSNIMGLSLTSFEAALSKLHSVLTLETPPDSVQQKPGNPIPWRIHFHHASFMEFLVNPARAGTHFWIRHPQHYEFLATRGIVIINEMLEGPGGSLKYQTSSVTLSAPLDRIDKEAALAVRSVICDHVSGRIFDWFASASLGHQGKLLVQLTRFDFRKFWTIRKSKVISRSALEKLISNVPEEYQGQIIKQYRPRHLALKWLKDHHTWSEPKLGMGYILGQGEKSIKVEFTKDGQISINQNM